MALQILVVVATVVGVGVRVAGPKVLMKAIPKKVLVPKQVPKLPAPKQAPVPQAAPKPTPGNTAPKKHKGKEKSKKKLKCGDDGPYGELQKKTAGGKFDRDHIPSKAALKARAAELKGEKLTPAEAKAIDKAGQTIAIPRQAHIDVSPTYGQSLGDAAKDAGNLAGSAKRDVDAMLEKIDEYDADGGCKKAYKKASKKILEMSNNDFDKMLRDVMGKANK